MTDESIIRCNNSQFVVKKWLQYHISNLNVKYIYIYIFYPPEQWHCSWTEWKEAGYHWHQISQHWPSQNSKEQGRRCHKHELPTHSLKPVTELDTCYISVTVTFKNYHNRSISCWDHHSSGISHSITDNKHPMTRVQYHRKTKINKHLVMECNIPREQWPWLKSFKM